MFSIIVRLSVMGNSDWSIAVMFSIMAAELDGGLHCEALFLGKGRLIRRRGLYGASCSAAFMPRREALSLSKYSKYPPSCPSHLPSATAPL